jgi:spore coat protein CotH
LTAAQPTSGPKVRQQDVESIPDTDLYDQDVVRTFFLTFESSEWEKELADFRDTDVDVPATLQVDGKVYKKVGVHFRGMSSYSMVGEGQKRSLNISMELAKKGQNLLGYKTLNLLNSHEDPSFLRTVLYSRIAREYLPAPKANLVHLVINGESWGIYSNVQQFNKEFLKENFGSTAGTRWKVQGSPNGQGTLEYLGANPQAYRGIYQIKSKDSPEAWKSLIEMTRVLNQTPAEKMKQMLEPLLDVDGALRFLALENTLINNDGYWIRTSDYALYLDDSGRIHLVPHDMNEGFSVPRGPGFGDGGGRPAGRQGPPGFAGEGRMFGSRGQEPNGEGPGWPPRGEFKREENARVDGLKLDPLFAANDRSKPLIHRLLSVHEYRLKYQSYVREIAEKSLNWQRLGPVAERLHAAIEPIVKSDGRKLNSYEEFESSLRPKGGSSAEISLQRFAVERRMFLLEGNANGSP